MGNVSPPSPFKKTCPCTILSPLFKIFQITLPPPGEVIKTYFPHFNKKGGLDYVSLHTSWLISVIIRKKSGTFFSVVNSDVELDFHPPLSDSFHIVHNLVN